VVTPQFTHDASGTAPDDWRSALSSADIPDLSLRTRSGGTIERLVVVAAHPDDETLGAAGLISTLNARGIHVDVVLATAGERSHPDSPTLRPDELATLRVAESEEALAALAVPDGRHRCLGFPDGLLADWTEELTAQLVAIVGDGRATMLAGPWRDDGHPDHDAAGSVCAAVAYRTGATLVEYPIWYWHWATPEPRTDFRRLPLPEPTRAAKAAAIACHRTQTQPLSTAPGDEVMLTPTFLEHFTHDETYVLAEPTDDALHQLHAVHSDPWGVDSRWYEQRKRDLVLALLPLPKFAHALDLGCSTGALTEALAERCGRVTAVDNSLAAITRARARLSENASVDVVELDITSAWPPGRFDLVVLSEVGYFLSPTGLDTVIDRIAGSLEEDGVVVLAHWRHDISGWVSDADDVHRGFAAEPRLPPVAAVYRDRDVELILLATPSVLPQPSQ